MRPPDIRQRLRDGGGCPACLDKAVELVAMVLPATAAQRRLEGLGRRQVTVTVLPVAPESRSEAAEGRGREDDPNHLNASDAPDGLFGRPQAL